MVAFEMQHLQNQVFEILRQMDDYKKQKLETAMKTEKDIQIL